MVCNVNHTPPTHPAGKVSGKHAKTKATDTKWKFSAPTNLNSCLKAIIDSKIGKLKIKYFQFNKGCKKICTLYDYSEHDFQPISIPSKTLTPKCYSPKSQLPEQTKQDKTFPALYTVA